MCVHILFLSINLRSPLATNKCFRDRNHGLTFAPFLTLSRLTAFHSARLTWKAKRFRQACCLKDSIAYKLRRNCPISCELVKCTSIVCEIMLAQTKSHVNVNMRHIITSHCYLTKPRATLNVQHVTRRPKCRILLKARQPYRLASVSDALHHCFTCGFMW